ncbi:hypothetical protein LMG3410_01468 [Achromobacter aegrifaciens]|uniref:Uncharacterized protein n=2 Tax=Alcaligenaceae TaxID=506 RepID=A0ABM8LKA3_9BURK|nr:hypothetical protein LMG3410_01468 [Achromobacter aegrifaciens]CAB3914964.1 hypothetical protein LMG3415_05182 [Achromobacter mucicolens]
MANTPPRDERLLYFHSLTQASGHACGFKELKMSSPNSGFLARVKREAKLRAKRDGIPHSQALESIAREHGFPSWHNLRKSHTPPPAAGASSTIKALPVDPVLPAAFDDTPNERRSRKQLDEWWDRPFAITRPNGSFDVRCLHGGAWDRSSWLGSADDLAAATALAERELRAWQRRRAEPLVSLDEGAALVVQMPERPDRSTKILARCESIAAAAQWIANWHRAQGEADELTPRKGPAQ